MKNCWLHSLTSQGKEASNHSQEDEHLGSTEGKEGEDETDHQDDKAAEEHGSGRPPPRYKGKKTAISKTDMPNLKITIKASIGIFFY